MCENDLQNTVSTDFRVQMTVFQVVPFGGSTIVLVLLSPVEGPSERTSPVPGHIARL